MVVRGENRGTGPPWTSPGTVRNTSRLMVTMTIILLLACSAAVATAARQDNESSPLVNGLICPLAPDIASTGLLPGSSSCARREWLVRYDELHSQLTIR